MVDESAFYSLIPERDYETLFLIGGPGGGPIATMDAPATPGYVWNMAEVNDPYLWQSLQQARKDPNDITRTALFKEMNKHLQ